MNDINASIYNFDNPNVLIKRLCIIKKTDSSSFSIRALASRLGLKSHTALHSMIAGKRKIPMNIVSSLGKYFKLTNDEQAYFETLVRITHAKSKQEVIELKKQLHRQFKKKSVNITEVENVEILKSPLSFFILELIDIMNVPFNAHFIHSKLFFKYSIQEIQTMLDSLMKYNYIKIKNDYIIRSTGDHLYSKVDIPIQAVKQYHKDVMKLAAVALEKQSLYHREYNGVCLKTQISKIPEMKQFIRDFIKDFIARFETKDDSEIIVQLNSQLFKLMEYSI